MRQIIKSVFVLVLCFILIDTAFAQSKIKDLKPTVILISIDGMRYDYLDRFEPKQLKTLAKNGVRAKWMIPSFPTKTFPNHYTIATGLYPQNHGIVENSVYDFGTVFTASKREEVENGRWWLGEPIWVTAEKQGQVAASFFFVGSEAPIKGILPTFWKSYDGKIPNEERVDTALSWLDLPQEKRPTIITLYFSDVDDAGHEFSPEAAETGIALRNVDKMIERLVDGLKKRKVSKKVNIIVVSDHGMVKNEKEQITYLDDAIDLKKAERILYTDEIIQIFPIQGETEGLMISLKNFKNATCWKKGEIPARLHYNDGPRVAPIICSADEGWMMTTRERVDQLNKRFEKQNPRGGHGYDNKYQSMQATFIANGPAFKKGFVAEPFENIEVYNIMCRILGLNPAENDGNIVKVKTMLK